MAKTTHCSISAATVIEGVPLIKWGNLAAQDYPGYFEYLSATATITKCDSDTAATIRVKPGVVEFRPRVGTDNTRTSADSQLATTDQTPLVIGGLDGPVMIVGLIDDQNNARYAHQRLIISANGGAATISASANTHTSLRAARDIADNDTYAAIWMSP